MPLTSEAFVPSNLIILKSVTFTCSSKADRISFFVFGAPDLISVSFSLSSVVVSVTFKDPSGIVSLTTDVI